MFVTVWSGWILQCRLWQSWPLLFLSCFRIYSQWVFIQQSFIVARFVQKYEDLFDKTASQSVFFPLFAHDMKKIKRDSNWLFLMLKCSLGPSLLHAVPRQKKMGKMLHRKGTNLLECLHLALVEQQKVTSELKANNDALARKIGSGQ